MNLDIVCIIITLFSKNHNKTPSFCTLFYLMPHIYFTMFTNNAQKAVHFCTASFLSLFQKCVQQPSLQSLYAHIHQFLLDLLFAFFFFLGCLFRFCRFGLHLFFFGSFFRQHFISRYVIYRFIVFSYAIPLPFSSQRIQSMISRSGSPKNSSPS